MRFNDFDTLEEHSDGLVTTQLLRDPKRDRCAVIIIRDNQITALDSGGRERTQWMARATSSGVRYVGRWVTEATAREWYERWTNDEPALDVTPDELRDWRDRLGMSQASAAETLGIPLRTYQRYEAGDTAPMAYLRLAMERIEG